MNLIAAALQAQRRGLYVFPVEPGGKRPLPVEPGKPYTIKWSEWQTNSLDRIVQYWSWTPDANIGIAAKPSGLLVVDCDTPKTDGDIDGQYALTQLVASLGAPISDLDETLHVQTGSGGLHLYYRWPAGLTASQASLRPTVDVRSNGGERGGYVLGPGSVTDKGPYRVVNDMGIANAPGWLVELCRERPRQPKKSSPFLRPDRTGAMAGLVRTVLHAPDGNLNNSLMWAARCASSDGVPIERAFEELGAAYVDACGRGGQRQAEATIRSAYRNQERKDGS